jgi:transposase-like protein
MKIRTQSRRKAMEQHIAQCIEGGMHVRQYCLEQNIKSSTYYYWLKKLQAPTNKNMGSFLRVQPIEQSSRIEISLVNGVKICFENLVPADYLKQLLS